MPLDCRALACHRSGAPAGHASTGPKAHQWMEYAACGLAGVFADLPPYQGVVEQERTGLLVGPDPKDWCQAVERLVRDAALRKRLAHQAWEAVSREHLLSARAVLYLEAWQAATQRGAP